MYAIYLRKSRKDVELEQLGQGETLARHRKTLTELAQKKELKISKVYEEVVSGESIADRPQMQILLDDVSAGRYKGVLVMEIERLARGNTKDQGEVSEAFAMSKTLIITPQKTYDPTNEFDEEYFEFGLFMSRREYKTIRRRMQRGIIASVKEGNYVASTPPFGYDIVRINKKERTLKLNDDSKYIEMIFDWFVNDRLSCGEIARKLTELGVPTKSGNPMWNRATIKDMLRNDVYRGKIRWYKRKQSKEYENGEIIKKNRRQSKDDYLLIDGKHPAIISEEMFEKAQTLFTGRVPVKAYTSLVNPLAKLMFCARCGKGVSYKRYMTLPNKSPIYFHRESTNCKLKSLPAKDVMNALMFSLKSIVEDFEFKMTNEHIQSEKKRVIESINTLEKELVNSQNRHKQLFDYFERNVYTEEEFLERKEILNSKIENLKTRLEEEKSKQVDDINYEEKVIKFTEVINSLNDDSVDAKEKNELLKEIIERIEYDSIDYGMHKGGKVILDIELK